MKLSIINTDLARYILVFFATMYCWLRILTNTMTFNIIAHLTISFCLVPKQLKREERYSIIYETFSQKVEPYHCCRRLSASVSAQDTKLVSGLALRPIVNIAVAAPNAKYQGPSQDSHCLPPCWGDSLKSKPPGSCLPSEKKLSFEDEPLIVLDPLDSNLVLAY